jgi:hypothetical protein
MTYRGDETRERKSGDVLVRVGHGELGARWPFDDGDGGGNGQ